MRSVLTLAILAGAVMATGWPSASVAEPDVGGAQTLRLRGTPSCYLALSGLAEAYMEEHPGIEIDFGGAVSSMGVIALKEGRADAAYVEWPLRKILAKMWPSEFPDIAQPGPEWTFAQTALGFVVNKGNRAGDARGYTGGGSVKTSGWAWVTARRISAAILTAFSASSEVTRTKAL